MLSRLRAFHLAAGKQREALSYVWARAVPARRGLTVLVPHNAPVFLLGDDCYDRQSGGNVRLAPDVLNGMLVQFAASDWDVLVNVHDHWFDERTAFSGIDDGDDLEFDRYLRRSFEPALARNPHIGPRRAIHNVSVVLAREGLDARVVDVRCRRAGALRRFDRVLELGANWVRHAVGREPAASLRDPRLVRQADFVAPRDQATLADMGPVLLAGAGGMGSIIAEALLRSGVHALDIVDDDRVSLSNLNRWQGGEPADIGVSKVRRLAARLRRMFPDARVRAFDHSLFDPRVQALLAQTSVVVGALDNDEARRVMNRAASQYIVPYFDAGVAVQKAEQGWDFRTRFFAVLPGHTPCMECTQLVLFDREATAEAFMDERTARAHRAAGYVAGHQELDAPSVYALNLRAAGLLVTEFLNYVCGWRPTAVVISESWQSGSFMRLDRENFPETINPDCPVCNHYAGAGNTEILPRPRLFQPRQVLLPSES